jgi:hypothetical protein
MLTVCSLGSFNKAGPQRNIITISFKIIEEAEKEATTCSHASIRRSYERGH